MTHICVGKLTIFVSDNNLSSYRRQAVIWTSAELLWIGPLGIRFSEILIEIQTFSLKKIRLKVSSVKCCLFRHGLAMCLIDAQILPFAEHNGAYDVGDRVGHSFLAIERFPFELPELLSEGIAFQQNFALQWSSAGAEVPKPCEGLLSHGAPFGRIHNTCKRVL